MDPAALPAFRAVSQILVRHSLWGLTPRAPFQIFRPEDKTLAAVAESVAPEVT